MACRPYDWMYVLMQSYAFSSSFSFCFASARIQGTNVKLETEEDIAKWIAERKRKWPSARNMELKVCLEDSFVLQEATPDY